MLYSNILTSLDLCEHIVANISISQYELEHNTTIIVYRNESH